MIPTAKKNKNASDAITSKTASNSTNFLSFDSFLENVSPAALSTMLMGKLMNVTSLFQQQGSSMNNTSTSDDELSQETWKLKQQSGSSLLNDSKDGDAQLTTSPNEMSTTSLVSRLKRNSLFFSKPSAMTDTNSDEGEAFVTDTLPSQDYFNGTQHQPTENESNRKTRPLSGSYSLSKIPRAVTDAIKHQVIRADNTNSTNSEASSASSDTEQIQVNANDTRSRSSSLSALRHHISPFNLYNKMNNHNLQNVTNSLPHLSTANASMKNNQGDVPINSHQETDFLPTRNDDSAVVSTRKHRAKSMGSMLISGTWHKLALSSGDYYYQQQHLNESQHKHPKGPAWLSNKLIDIIDATWSGNSLSYVEDEEHNENDDSSEKRITSRKMVMDLYIHKDIENPQLKEEEQQTMNDHLDANFPMLLKTEQVEAGKYNTFACLHVKNTDSFLYIVLKASFWRTIPYSGRIYITGRYFCFHSKILAGQQKLVVPWQDVIQVNTIKSKSYYLTHAITMIVKDMTDEVKIIRGLLYSILTEYFTLDRSTLISRRSNYVTCTSIFAN
jgi:sterol 3beta-glucosyltransferase